MIGPLLCVAGVVALLCLPAKRPYRSRPDYGPVLGFDALWLAGMFLLIALL